MNTQCIVGSPEGYPESSGFSRPEKPSARRVPGGKHFKNVLNLSHFATQTVKTMRNNSETDRTKSAQYKVKSRRDTTYGFYL